MIFSAAEFTKHQRAIQSQRIISVRGGRVKRTPNGQILDGDDHAGAYRHPWQCSLAYGADGMFHCSVQPGMVNGCEVLAGGKPITQGGTLAITHWGGNAGLAAGIPSAYKERDIKSVQIMLITPRITASQSVSVTDTVDMQVTFNAAAFYSQPRYQLVTSAQFAALAEPTEEDWLNGTAVEPIYDQFHIASAFAVATEGVEGTPDQAWSVYVKHYVFWNLCHASQQDVGKSTEPLRVSFNTALAGGIGNQPLQELMSQDVIMAEKIRAWLGRTSSKGHFWTV